MQITLRKANELSRLAVTAAGKVEFFANVVLTVYDSYTPQVILEAARTKFLAGAKQKQDLILAGLAIRKLIGIANAKSGINELIADRVAIEAQEKLIVAELLVVEPKTATMGRRLVGAPQYDDADLLAKKLNELKAKIKRQEETPATQFEVREAVSTDITAHIGTEALVLELKEKLASLARDKVEVQDKITGTNFSTQITLASETVEVLRANKLIK